MAPSPRRHPSRPHATSHPTRRGVLGSALALAGLGTAGCATEEQASAVPGGAAPSTELDPDLHAAAVDAASALAGGKEWGGSIEYIGPNGGAEGAIMQKVYSAFTEATGTEVNYTGSQDSNNIVQSRVQAGNPPAVADLALGVAQAYAADGHLLDLGEVVGHDVLAENYPPSLLEAASWDGTVFGIYQGFSNFMLWYNPSAYTGPADPGSWQELVDWTTARAEQGLSTWGIAEESGASSGFPGAQFIEVLFAKKHGPELLRRWGSGDLPWTSDEVADAWRMFGALAANPDTVAGGVTGSLAAPIASGYSGLVTSPEDMQASVWGSWLPGLVGGQVKPGENLDFMPVPASDPAFASTEIFQSTVAIGFQDTEPVRAFLQYAASPEAQTLLASADQWTVSNTKVPSSTYSSPLLQRAAETFFSDDVTLATGPNVLADAATGAAFYRGVVAYLQDPDSLEDILATLDATAKGA